ncbi:ankyrin [Fusarium mexicanum]|uniref:Ankyrin n=1 Tax=Fusarium mexicanum TaxID=751941 RepID=A0A8H5IMJ4_9HYPO|nr:ankyrin [Fusarium mexicanum]
MEAITLSHLDSLADDMTVSCDHIVFMLRNIQEQWHDAPYFLMSIMESCQKFHQTIYHFRHQLHDELGIRLDALHSILGSFHKVINWVEKSTREIQPRGNAAEDRNLWKRFRVEVSDSTMKNCTNELDKQNSFIKSLLGILKLAFDVASRKPSYRFQRQAIEAITDVEVKGKVQASITGLRLSGAWVIWLIEELIRACITTFEKLNDPVCTLAFVGQTPDILLQTSWGITCKIPKSASREELSVALLEAAAAGSLRDAKALLKRGARCTVRDENLMTSLHLAASWGHYTVVKLLLSYKNKDWFAQGGITPIHLAARCGHSKVVKLLISNGGHDWINDRADSPVTLQKFRHPRVISHGKTFSARELAAIYGHENAVLAFPSTKKDDILHAMSSACALGNQSMVETIWRHHKQRSYFKRHSNPTKLVSTFHAPPLHLAVTSGNPALVAYLLERGFPVNDQGTVEGSQYSSPAHYAAMTGSVEILYLLKSSGGAVTSLDFWNRTPLSEAGVFVSKHV